MPNNRNLFMCCVAATSAARGEVVTRLASPLSGPPADFGLATDAPEAQRRAKLARGSPVAIASGRVIVNRLWHYHFRCLRIPERFPLTVDGLPIRVLIGWRAN